MYSLPKKTATTGGLENHGVGSRNHPIYILLIPFTAILNCESWERFSNPFVSCSAYAALVQTACTPGTMRLYCKYNRFVPAVQTHCTKAVVAFLPCNRTLLCQYGMQRHTLTIATPHSLRENGQRRFSPTVRRGICIFWKKLIWPVAQKFVFLQC